MISNTNYIATIKRVDRSRSKRSSSGNFHHITPVDITHRVMIGHCEFPSFFELSVYATLIGHNYVGGAQVVVNSSFRLRLYFRAGAVPFPGTKFASEPKTESPRCSCIIKVCNSRDYHQRSAGYRVDHTCRFLSRATHGSLILIFLKKDWRDQYWLRMAMHSGRGNNC